MIILDTNVLSTLMCKLPDAAVVRWLDRQPAESIWITSVTLFEARLGIALLPDGKRRAALASAFARLLEEDLQHRVARLLRIRAAIRDEAQHFQQAVRRHFVVQASFERA